MILILGYGNPGRGDDGLGPALASRMAERGWPGVEVQIDYQLTVEHAMDLARARRVVFVDARVDGTEPFDFAVAAPSRAGDIASHSLSPETVLALAETLYDSAPEAWILGISGAEFGRVHEGLSDTARRNLDRAERFLSDWLQSSLAEKAP